MNNICKKCKKEKLCRFTFAMDYILKYYFEKQKYNINKNILYSDTDSIIISDKHNNVNLIREIRKTYKITLPCPESVSNEQNVL